MGVTLMGMVSAQLCSHSTSRRRWVSREQVQLLTLMLVTELDCP